MTVHLSYPDTAAPRDTLAFLVETVAAIPYQSTHISMVVENEEHVIMYSAALDTNLHRGRNQVTFQWNAAEMPPGNYIMTVDVDYADSYPVARCTLPFSKVSAAQWEQDLAAAAATLSMLEQQMNKFPAQEAKENTYEFQLNIAKEALAEGRAAMANEDWHTLAHRVAYLQRVSKTLHAGLVFSGSTPEIAAAYDSPPLDRVEIRDGGLYAANAPVFLFGFTLNNNAPAHEQLQQARTYGLNFAMQKISIADAPADVTRRIDAAVQAAQATGIALAIQFDQENIAGDIMDRWPELLETGFVDMAHAGFSAQYTERLVNLAAAISGNPGIVCLSIARAPQFKYGGEPVRQQFIARIQERYPDRIELNRLWRSHLAEYEEITIWGDHAEHNYQNRRAYQYEWQSFHRELITLFLAQLKQELSQIAPDVPTMVTLPDTVFEPGETRFSVNREMTTAMMDLSGCMATAGPGETLYAINYPRSHAYYTLMRSYAPNKPIVNLGGDIDLVGLDSAAARFSLVSSALWEGVMSGLNALALTADSALLNYPEALEAYALAARDINRLAPIVTAFQQASPQIGILFSEASKIMDDGVPHLESAKFAFEGASFAGYTMRFITESQIERGALAPIRVLILPETLAVSDATFEHLSRYVDEGGMVARVGTPIPYNERGLSRGDVIRSTSNTVLVRGMNLPTEYLHAMDAAQVGGVLPEIARPINAFGYPLEGVRSRYVEHDGEGYLYIINLRKEPVNCYLTGVSDSGRDLIQGRDVDFPRILPSLEPMLIRMDRRELVTEIAQF